MESASDLSCSRRFTKILAAFRPNFRSGSSFYLSVQVFFPLMSVFKEVAFDLVLCSWIFFDV